MENTEEIANKAVSIVCTSPSQTMIGARLGALIKIEYPAFSPLRFGVKNLRQFVRKYVVGLSEVGHTGFDVIFAPLQAPVTVQVDAPTEVPVVANPKPFIRLPVDLPTWRVYANPSNPLRVAFNPESSEVKTVDAGAVLAQPWVNLEKPSSERHRSLAEEFTSSQSDEIRGELERILASERWYHQFSTVVKRLNVGAAWATLRIQRLSHDLEQQFLSYGTPLNAVKASKVATPKSVQPTHTSELAPDEKRVPSDEIRELVIRLVRHLPVEDLRALRFPLGSIIDALSSR